MLNEKITIEMFNGLLFNIYIASTWKLQANTKVFFIKVVLGEGLKSIEEVGSFGVKQWFLCIFSG